jgi:hypothetical protein
MFVTIINWFCFISLVNAYNYILIPGMGGSILYNEMKKKIWPPDIFLNFDDFHFKYDKNCEIIVPEIDNIGNLEDVKIDSKFTYFFTKNTYYSTLIHQLEKQNHNVYAFPYDFRFIFISKYYLSLFEEFNRFISKLEGDIVFICHSMGGLLLQDFINNYISPTNVRKIKKIYYVNVPFGGVPFSLYAIYDSLYPNKEISLNNLVSTQIIPYLTSKIKYLHHYGGLYLCLPIFEDPVFRKENHWYNIHNLDLLLKNDPICQTNYEYFKKHHMKKRIQSIDLDQTIVYSTNLTTSVFLDYDSKTILTSYGDGLVPLKSLLYPRKWKYQPSYIELYNQEHSKINNYLPLINTFSKCSDKLIY